LADAGAAPPLPTQKTRGWEFTDLSELDLDAYVAARGGENFGWPAMEHGVNSKGKFVDAIYSYPFASIVGGDFCDEKKCAAWPREYWGKYFFMDFVHGWIKVLDPEHPADVKEFASGVPFGTDLRFSEDGNLYVLVRDMWVNEKSFYKTGTGVVVKIGPKNSELRIQKSE